MTQNEEQYILEKVALGNHDAFEAIFLKYYPKVKYFIGHMIKSETIAEELSQDVFLKVWTSRENLPEIRSFNAYIFRMAKNAALNYLDHKYIEDSYISNLPLKLESSPLHEEIEAKELELLIRITVDKMPTQRRKVYIMSRVENLKNEEIAEKLNISKKTVENHLNLALKEIKSILNSILIFFI